MLHLCALIDQFYCRQDIVVEAADGSILLLLLSTAGFSAEDKYLWTKDLLSMVNETQIPKTSDVKDYVFPCLHYGFTNHFCQRVSNFKFSLLADLYQGDDVPHVDCAFCLA